MKEIHIHINKSIDITYDKHNYLQITDNEDMENMFWVKDPSYNDVENIIHALKNIKDEMRTRINVR